MGPQDEEHDEEVPEVSARHRRLSAACALFAALCWSAVWLAEGRWWALVLVLLNLAGAGFLMRAAVRP